MRKRRIEPSRVLLIVLVAIAAVAATRLWGGKTKSFEDATLEEAYGKRLADVWVEMRGRVELVLPDDNQGSRHQRLIVDAGDGHTVLILHNIDLAKRVPAVVGEDVEVRGKYIWNDKGGKIHWTHHDPDGRFPGGWIRHRGETYR